MPLSAEDPQELAFSQLVHNGIIDRSGGVPTIQGERAYKIVGLNVALIMFDRAAEWEFNDKDLDEDHPDDDIDPLMWNLDFKRNGRLQSAAIRRISELPPRFSKQLTDETRARAILDSHAKRSTVLIHRPEMRPIATPGGQATRQQNERAPERSGSRSRKFIAIPDPQESDEEHEQTAFEVTASDQRPPSLASPFSEDAEFNSNTSEAATKQAKIMETHEVVSLHQNRHPTRKSLSADNEGSSLRRVSERTRKRTEKAEAAATVQTQKESNQRKRRVSVGEDHSSKRPRLELSKAADDEEHQVDPTDMAIAQVLVDLRTQAAPQATSSTLADSGHEMVTSNRSRKTPAPASKVETATTSQGSDEPVEDELVESEASKVDIAKILLELSQTVHEKAMENNHPVQGPRVAIWKWEGRVLRRWTGSISSDRTSTSSDSTRASTPQLSLNTSMTEASSEQEADQTNKSPRRFEHTRNE